MELDKRRQGAAGFTLIEMLTAIVVAGILVAIAVPRFYLLLPTIRVSSAARQVATDLQLARMRAISQHTPYTVTFTSPKNYNFGADSRDLDQLYPGTTAAVLPANPSFNPVGTATADTTITLSNGSVTKQVQVSAIGRVKIL